MGVLGEGMERCAPAVLLRNAALSIPPIWLFLSCILYNETVIINRVLSCVLLVDLVNYQI